MCLFLAVKQTIKSRVTKVTVDKDLTAELQRNVFHCREHYRLKFQKHLLHLFQFPLWLCQPRCRQVTRAVGVKCS